MNRTSPPSIDLNLVYLAQLTQQGLKPLSRYESYQGGFQEEYLHALGLHTDVVTRQVANGRTVRELIFSRSHDPLRCYATHFQDTAVRHTPESMRVEGSLFGYPRCCVDSFVAGGYVPNRIPRADQEILFHWACPACEVTPDLVPRYWHAYRAALKRARRRNRAALCLPIARTRPHRRAVAEAAALIALSASVAHAGEPGAVAAAGAILPTAPVVAAETAASVSLDHMLPTPDDTDADGLTDLEEAYFGTDPGILDTHGTGEPDGYTVAQRLAQQVWALPDGPLPDAPYAMNLITKGAYPCSVCGEWNNMGARVVVDPVNNLEMWISFTALHFMERGGFTHMYDDYTGTVQGRVDPCLLDIIVNGNPGSRIRRDGDNVVVSWYGLTNRQYKVWSASALPGWSPGPIFDGAGEVLQYVRPGTNHAFFAAEEQ